MTDPEFRELRRRLDSVPRGRGRRIPLELRPRVTAWVRRKIATFSPGTTSRQTRCAGHLRFHGPARLGRKLPGSSGRGGHTRRRALGFELWVRSEDNSSKTEVDNGQQTSL